MQVRVPLAIAQPEDEVVGDVTSVGIGSVRTTEVAVEGPPLLRVMVYVIGSPATTGLGDPDLLTMRSTSLVTFATAVPVLLPENGSGVVLLAVAELVIVVGLYPAAKVPVI